MTLAMANCITNLIASVNSETTRSMHALRAGVPALPSPALTMRRATDHTASLAACNMPGKNEIWTRVPANTLPSKASSNSMSCVSSRYFLPSSAVQILDVLRGAMPTLPLYMFLSSLTSLLTAVSTGMLPLSAILGGVGLGVGVGVSSSRGCFPFVMFIFVLLHSLLGPCFGWP